MWISIFSSLSSTCDVGSDGYHDLPRDSSAAFKAGMKLPMYHLVWPEVACISQSRVFVITINAAQFPHRRSAVPTGENDNGGKRKRRSVPVGHHIIPFDLAKNQISWEKDGWRWPGHIRVNFITGARDFRPCS
jgi:hypothetical protein